MAAQPGKQGVHEVGGITQSILLLGVPGECQLHRPVGGCKQDRRQLDRAATGQLARSLARRDRPHVPRVHGAGRLVDLPVRVLAEGLSTPEDPIDVNVFDPGAMPKTGLARDWGTLGRFVWNGLLPSYVAILRRMGIPFSTAEASGRALAASWQIPPFGACPGGTSRSTKCLVLRRVAGILRPV